MQNFYKPIEGLVLVVGERERPCRYDFLAFKIGLLKQNLCLMFPQKQQGDFYGTRKKDF